MTIYDAIKARIDAGEEEVPVTSLTLGSGHCTALFHESDFHPYPIRVEYEKGEIEEGFTADGKLRICDKFPSLALGHHDSPEETAQAIKDQNFDVE